MYAVHVISLVEGIHGRLPVDVPFHGHVVDQCHLRKVVRIEVLGNDPEIFAEWFGIWIKAKPNPTTPRRTRKPLNCELFARHALWEGLHIGHVGDLAF